jgi:hypothetical protein
MAHIEATALTTFDVHPDGTHVRINVRDQTGAPSSMVLPANCANELMMALPRMVEAAMRNSHKNEEVRLVHQLACVYIEAGETAHDGAPQFILTTDTGNGYWVSFAVSEAILKTLANTIVSSVSGSRLPETLITTH